MSKLEIGDWVDSKNGVEFAAQVIKIDGGNVTVSYDIEGYGDITTKTVSKNKIEGSSGRWYAESWTF